MPYERDFIVRAIESFARAIASAVALRRKGEYAEARSELDRMAVSLFGLETSLLALVGPRAIADQLGHLEQVACLVRLLEERAAVERAAHDEAAGARWAGWAADLRSWQPSSRS